MIMRKVDGMIGEVLALDQEDQVVVARILGKIHRIPMHQVESWAYVQDPQGKPLWVKGANSAALYELSKDEGRRGEHISTYGI